MRRGVNMGRVVGVGVGTLLAIGGFMVGSRMTADAKEVPSPSGATDIPVAGAVEEGVPSGSAEFAYKVDDVPPDNVSLGELEPTITEHHVDVNGYQWGYWLYRARPNGRHRPLILSLHGSGESGSDLGALRGTSSLSRWILDGSLEPDCDVLMPQCPSFGWDTEALHALLLQVTDELGSDMSRLSCTGVSMGGFGTWDMLATYPDLFEAAAPIASSGTNFSSGDLSKCTARVRSMIGSADGYDASGAVAIVRDGGGDAKQVVVDGAGHSEMCNIYGNEEYNPVPFLLGEEGHSTTA